MNKTALLALVVLTAPSAFAESDLPATTSDLPPITRDEVEVVFVLDTTGSMSGLLEGAKKKIWYIAREIMQVAPQARIKMGLVAYRDKGDAYVTWSHPLTSDLDGIYRGLVGLQAGGGGDTPEHVNEGLRVGVERMDWSPGNAVLKMIFLVGDAPAQMNYDDDKKHHELSQTAVRRFIYINTIQCGANPATKTMWERIAHNSEGRYAAIPAGGGVSLDISTPWDGKLASLARALDATEINYGSDERRAQRSTARARTLSKAAASPSIAADRATVMAKSGAPASADLVTLFREDPSAYYAVPAAALPPELRELDERARVQLIQARQSARAKIANTIADYANLRARYLHAESAKNRSAFDGAVVSTIEAQMQGRR